MDETNIELFGFCWKEITASQYKNFVLLWNMVVVVSWYEFVLLYLGQDSLPSLIKQF